MKKKETHAGRTCRGRLWAPAVSHARLDNVKAALGVNSGCQQVVGA